LLGKRYIESAAEQFADKVEVQVTWRPFQLDPSASTEGIPKLEAYTQKFGAQRAASILDPKNPMVQRFREAGVELSFDGLTGSTWDAHRLLAHAEKVGGREMQNKLMDELFLDYFERARFVGSSDVLLQAAERAGVPDAKLVTENGEYMREEVAQQMKQFARGVRGVPHFIIDGGKTVISGAQPTDVWEEIFELAAEKTESGGSA
jgi:predicted DsbA family dithiol-disulfide isomerase